jgi:thioredoxin 1
MVLEVNTDNFEAEVKTADTPVIVDFWATWCGPCRMMAPVFEEVSSDYEGKLKFVKTQVDADGGQELASGAGVQGIPCLIVFNKGEEVGRIVGFSPKDELKAKIDEILGKL